MTTSRLEPFRLGEWIVEPRENRIERAGERRSLEPKVLEVLLFLVSEPHRVRLRREILDAVWADTFVTEEVLTNAIWELRRAFGDDARKPSYIRTVPRKGYKLVAEVESLPPPDPEPAGTDRRRRSAAMWVLAVALLGVGAWTWFERRAVEPTRGPSGPEGPPTASRIPGGWQFRTGGDVRSSPRLAGGSVLVGSDDGYLYALDPLSGAEQWRFDAGGAVRDNVEVRDDRVFVATEGYIRAVDLTSGRELWRRLLPVISPPTMIGQADGRLLVGSYDRRLYALDPATGSTIWSVPTRGENRTAAVVVEDVVAAGTDAGELLWIRQSDGTVLVRLDIGSAIVGLAAGQDRDAFAATEEGFLYRIAATGAELWRRDLESRLTMAPLARGGFLYQGIADGRLVALAAVDGSLRWTLQLRSAVGSPPRVIGDILYVGGLDDRLYAIDSDTGVERRHYGTGAGVVTRPLAVEGRILFGGLDGVVHALPLVGPWPSRPEPDWPEPGHPDVLTSGVAPTLRWRVEVDEPLRLAAAGDRLLLGTARGVWALGLETGERLWWWPASGGVGAQPTRVDGRVVFGTLDGLAVALDVRDGHELWRHDLGAGTLSEATAADGVVYLGDQKGRLHALDLATGSQVWRVATDHFINSSPLPLADRVVVGSCDEYIWAFDRQTGSLLWKSHAGECVVSDPVERGGRIVYASFSGEILALDLETGARQWTLATGGEHIWYRPLLVDGVLYAGSGDDHLYALDAEDGEELWRFRTGDRALTEVAPHGDTILFGSHDRRLYSVDRHSGEVRWRLETTRPVAELEVVGDTLYFVADDGWLLAYRLPGTVTTPS